MISTSSGVVGHCGTSFDTSLSPQLDAFKQQMSDYSFKECALTSLETFMVKSFLMIMQ